MKNLAEKIQKNWNATNFVSKFLKDVAVGVLVSKLYRIILSLVIMVVSGVIANNTESAVAYYVMYASLIYPLAMFVVMMVYAWIINPVRERKNKK